MSLITKDESKSKTKTSQAECLGTARARTPGCSWLHIFCGMWNVPHRSMFQRVLRHITDEYQYPSFVLHLPKQKTEKPGRTGRRPLMNESSQSKNLYEEISN
jgi:hypothetical protein